MISKELLSEVLGFEIEKIASCSSRDIFFYSVEEYYKDYGESELDSINIYELMHMCKEWASMIRHDNPLTVETMYSISSKVDRFRGHAYLHMSPTTIKYEYHADTEPEAVFQACELILNNA